MRSLEEATYGPRVVAIKELTQVAHRRRFHVEKALFVVGMSVVLIATVFEFEPNRAMSLAELARRGRMLFFSLTMAAYCALSVVALASSTGIVLSEMTGRRLDVLRATPLSLLGIIAGKGLAVMMRSVLVLGLLVPILAAAQLAGGVSAGDVVKTFGVILSNVFFCTAVGIFVSAGAKSAVDRVVRPTLVLLLWCIVTALAPLPALLIPGLIGRMTAFAMSPVYIWAVILQSSLTWAGTAVNVVTNAVGGAAFMFAALGTLRTTIKSYEDKAHDPQMSAIARRQITHSRGKQRIGKLVIKVVDMTVRRTGGLVGGQVLRTHVASVAAPLIFLGVALVVLALAGIVAVLRQASFFWVSDALAYCAIAVFPVTLIVAGVEACGAIARERSDHTAEVLATTPAGGPLMILWKGGGVLAAQAIAVAVSIALMSAGTSSEYFGSGDRIWHPLIPVMWTAAFCAALLFLVALGMSLSLSLKTPAMAVGFAVAALAVATPFFQFGVLPDVWQAYRVGPRYDAPFYFELAVFGVGAMVLLGRNVIPALSAPLACVAAAWMIANAAYLGSSVEATMETIVPVAALAAPFAIHSGDAQWAAMPAVAVEALTAALLLCGMYPNFNRLFLRGAGRGK